MSGDFSAPEPHGGSAAHRAPEPGPPDVETGRAPSPWTRDDDVEVVRPAFDRAEQRLKEAHDEAQSIVRDAAEQASMLAANATRVAEQVISEAQKEADEITGAAHAEARDIRLEAAQAQQHADEVKAGADNAARVLRAKLASELAEERAAHDKELVARQTRLEERLARIVSEAEQRIGEWQQAAQVASDQLVAKATDELERARAEAEQIRTEARGEATELREAARLDASREMAEAAEQITWTEKIIVGLREAAELDADQIRAAAHRDGAESIRQIRSRIAPIVNAARVRARERIERAETEAATIVRAAQLIREQSEIEAGQTRETARAEGARILASAEDAAAARDARAERRLAEAESGARAVREQVAAELARTQRELHEVRRKAKEEEFAAINTARAEADELRAAARKMIAEARAEVAALVKRRNAIAGELGNLSGVIEALAVAEGHPEQSESPGGSITQ
jgi:vacuolar-type H+-ATPase subunit H